MSKAIKVINNSAFILVARVIETVSGIFVIGMLARYLGLSDFGEYSYVMAVVWISLPIISLAIPRILVKEMSQDVSNAAKYMGLGITWNLIAFIVFLSVLGLSNIIISMSPLYYLAAISIAVLASLTQTVGAAFIVYERMKYETYTSLIFTFFMVLFTAVVVYLDLGLSNVLLAATLAYLCGFLAAVFYSRKVAGFIPTPNADYKTLKRLLSGSLALSIIMVLWQLLLYSGVFFLRKMSGNEDVALFQASLRVFTRLMIIPLSVLAALLPELSRLAAAEESKDEFVHTVKSVYRLFLIVSMFITIAAFTTAREAMPFIYGKAFIDSVVGFQILVLSTTFCFLSTFFITLCIACNRITNFVIIKIIELMICLLLNLTLVSAYGHIGSIWALVASTFIMSLGSYYFFRDILQIDSLKSMSLIITSGFGIIFILNWMPSLNVLVSLTAGIVSFAMVMIMSKTITQDEFMPILRAIRHKAPKVIQKGG